MQRITITQDDELVKAIDRVMESRGYQNRSETIRDLTHAGLGQFAEDDETNSGRGAEWGIVARDCVAALIYVYDHNTRELAKRLTDEFHDHHDLTIATTHIHLDHRNCMEVAIPRGQTNEVRHVADHVIAERGVRHGRLVLVPVTIEMDGHRHGRHHRHDHVHVRHVS
jgi:CopG family transcriptional regulator, nickel-responsive regulator